MFTSVETKTGREEWEMAYCSGCLPPEYIAMNESPWSSLKEHFIMFLSYFSSPLKMIKTLNKNRKTQALGACWRIFYSEEHPFRDLKINNAIASVFCGRNTPNHPLFYSAKLSNLSSYTSLNGEVNLTPGPQLCPDWDSAMCTSDCPWRLTSFSSIQFNHQLSPFWWRHRLVTSQPNDVTAWLRQQMQITLRIESDQRRDCGR